MISIYKDIVRPAMFKFDAEVAHEMGKQSLKLISRTPILRYATNAFSNYENSQLHCALHGRKDEVELNNPLILSAGFDKDVELMSAFSALGFGGVEAGSVTYDQREGNLKPRLFRIEEDEALINFMGLNGKGAEAVRKYLDSINIPLYDNMKVGINVNKSPGAEDEIEDIVKSLRLVQGYGHWKTLNVSCPNTGEAIEEQSENLAEVMQAARKEVTGLLYFKLSPDLDDAALEHALDLGIENGVDGFVLSNTSTRRDFRMKSEIPDFLMEKGGLSGRPLMKGTHAIVAKAYDHVDGKASIIGCGGVRTAGDVMALMMAGADAVQLLTGFVYEGPWIAKHIKKELVKSVEIYSKEIDDVWDLEELVGVGHE